MKIISITQARMGSSRLPGKVMMPINGIPLIEYHFKRLQRSKLIHQFWLCTSELEQELPLISWAHNNNVSVFIGSELNVLERFYYTAKQANAKPEDLIIRLTGDCPLICPQVVDYTIEEHLAREHTDYTHLQKEKLPRGFDVEVFSMRLLTEAYQQAKDEASKEHVTYYIYTHMDNLNMRSLDYGKEGWGRYRLCVDEKDDFALIEKLLSKIASDSHDWLTISGDDICNLLDVSPEIAKINSAVRQKTAH